MRKIREKTDRVYAEKRKFNKITGPTLNPSPIQGRERLAC